MIKVGTNNTERIEQINIDEKLKEQIDTENKNVSHLLGLYEQKNAARGKQFLTLEKFFNAYHGYNYIYYSEVHKCLRVSEYSILFDIISSINKIIHQNVTLENNNDSCFLIKNFYEEIGGFNVEIDYLNNLEQVVSEEKFDELWYKFGTTTIGEKPEILQAYLNEFLWYYCQYYKGGRHPELLSSGLADRSLYGMRFNILEYKKDIEVCLQDVSSKKLMDNIIDIVKDGYHRDFIIEIIRRKQLVKDKKIAGTTLESSLRMLRWKMNLDVLKDFPQILDIPHENIRKEYYLPALIKDIFQKSEKLTSHDQDYIIQLLDCYDFDVDSKTVLSDLFCLLYRYNRVKERRTNKYSIKLLAKKGKNDIYKEFDYKKEEKQSGKIKSKRKQEPLNTKSIGINMLDTRFTRLRRVLTEILSESNNTPENSEKEQIYDLLNKVLNLINYGNLDFVYNRFRNGQQLNKVH